MKYILFGPPGIGKSTLIKALGGLDLEDVPQEDRLRTLYNTNYAWYGAADLNPDSARSGDFVWVCLMADPSIYASRRAERDRNTPGKGAQKQWDSPDQFFSGIEDKGVRYTKIDANGTTEETLNKLRELGKEDVGYQHKGILFTDNVPDTTLLVAEGNVKCKIVKGRDKPFLDPVSMTLDGVKYEKAGLIAKLQSIFRAPRLSERERKDTDKYSVFLTSKYAVIKSYDPTPSTVFRNACMREKFSEKQVTDLPRFSKETRVTPWDERDASATRAVRRNWKSCSRAIRKPDAFWSRPMFCAEDWYALMLPRDNTVGEDLYQKGLLKEKVHVDYLGYHSEVWRDFIYDLCDELMKSAVTDEEKDCIKLLMLDYASNVPEASSMAHTGMFKVGDDQWPPSDREAYSKRLGDYWKTCFAKAYRSPDSFRIKLNGSKSVGSDGVRPDGSPYDPNESRFTIIGTEGYDERVSKIKSMTEDAKSEYLSYMWARHDNSQFKLDWLPYLKERARRFIKFCKGPFDIRGYLTLLSDGNVPIHTQSTRRNNGDVPKCDLPFRGSFRPFRRHWYKKDRDYRYELKGYKWQEGVIDDFKYTQEYSKERDWVTEEAFLKVRPVFPGNNASFYPYWIQFATILMRGVEESSGGFPSLHPECFDALQRWYARHPRTRLLTFDRRTAEQWITDNWDVCMSLIPEFLRPIINGLGTVLTPSREGPRVTVGALFSGTALTTLINAVVGGFQMVKTVSDLFHIPFDAVLDGYFATVYEGKEEVELGGRTFRFQLGTDDQICFFEGDDPELSGEALEKYFEALRLSGEVTDDATVFGLHFTKDNCSVSEVLGLYKVFLFEKARIGDAIALKYSMRFRILERYRDVLRRKFLEHGFGSIEDYEAGAQNYLKKVEEFGFNLTDLFDSNSFSDSIIMAQGFSGYDPRTSEHKYPATLVTDLIDLLVEEGILKGGIYD